MTPNDALTEARKRAEMALRELIRIRRQQHPAHRNDADNPPGSAALAEAARLRNEACEWE